MLWPMAVIVNWNGVDVPEELKALKKGRYVLVPIDEPLELTEEQEAGLEDAIASIQAGEGMALNEAISQAWASIQAGAGRLAADILRDLAKVRGYASPASTSRRHRSLYCQPRSPRTRVRDARRRRGREAETGTLRR